MRKGNDFFKRVLEAELVVEDEVLVAVTEVGVADVDDIEVWLVVCVDETDVVELVRVRVA